MAQASDSLSPLSERLMSRSSRGPKVGASSRFFDRFGVANPYEQQTQSGDRSLAGLSFLSSEGYFSELRGLSDHRNRLLSRISGQRQRLRIHDLFQTTLATAASRGLFAVSAASVDGVLVDWSTQERSELPSVHEEAPRRRRTAAERALQAEVTSAHRTLAQLEELERHGAAERSELRGQVARLVRLPREKQADAAHRVGKRLTGVASVAARGTDFGVGQGGMERNGARPLAVAQRRQADHQSEGLRRRIESSPLVMQLEQRSEAPEPDMPPVQRRPRGTTPPQANDRSKTAVAAPVVRDARNQASVGRAGPPETTFSTRMSRPATQSTARLAQKAQRAAQTSYSDVSRGLRHSDGGAMPAVARAAVRAESGLVGSTGSVTRRVPATRSSRPVDAPLTQWLHPGESAPDASAETPVATTARAQGSSVGPLNTPSRPTTSLAAIDAEHSVSAAIERLPPAAHALYRSATAERPASRVMSEVTPYVGAQRRIDVAATASAPTTARTLRAIEPERTLAVSAPMEAPAEVDGPKQVRKATSSAAVDAQAPVPSAPDAPATRTFRTPKSVRQEPAAAARMPRVADTSTSRTQRSLARPALPIVDVRAPVTASRQNVGPQEVSSPTVRAVARATPAVRQSARGLMATPVAAAYTQSSVARAAVAQRLAPTPELVLVGGPDEEESAVGPVARAMSRSKQSARVGPTGQMIAPRAAVPSVARASDVGSRTAASNDRVEQRTSFLGRHAPDAPSEGWRPGRTVAPSSTNAGSRDVASTVVQRRADAQVEQDRGSVRSTRLDQPVPMMVARSADSPDEVATGLVSRAARRGREVAPEARQTLVPSSTPEVQANRAREASRSVMERASAFRTESTFAGESRTHRTASTAAPRSLAYRTQVDEMRLADTFRTPTSDADVATTFRTRASSGAEFEPTLLASVPHAEELLDAAPARRSVVPAAVPMVERSAARAARRVATGKTRISDSPVIRAPEPVLARPEATAVDSDVSSVRAVARSVERTSRSSSIPRAVVDQKTVDVSSQLLDRPSVLEHLKLDESQVAQAASVEDSSAGLQRAMRTASSVQAGQRDISMRALEPLQEPTAAQTRYEARVQVDQDGQRLGTAIVDRVTGRRLQDNSSRPAPQQAAPELPMELAEAPEAVREAFLAGGGRALRRTLDGLTERPIPREANTPVRRRRTWQRRGVAAEMGLLTSSLDSADFEPVAEDSDSPAWARRATSGTAGRAVERSSDADDEQSRRVAKPKVAEPASENRLLGALARADRAEDVVKVILDRRTEVRTIRGELPAEAVRLMERISQLSGPEADLIRDNRRVNDAPDTTMPSRSHKGNAGATQLSAGHDGVGSSRIMKLADKLMGLIHLAENSRQREAQDQVRMARDSADARAEGGALFPGMTVEDQDMNIRELQTKILGSVTDYFRDKEERMVGGETDDGSHMF